ncbi:MAG: nuclear transport factor 2 family protein [Myxococcota bacterium]
MDEVTKLVEIENIKRLKAKYMRCVDTKDWEGLESCFTEDATSSYGDGAYSFDGRGAIMKFLRDSMASNRFISKHQVHTPEIDIHSETEAEGTWYLEDMVAQLEQGWTLEGTGIYRDEYVKRDGEWRIRHTGYARIFEKTRPLSEEEVSSFKTRFDEA